MKFYNLLDGTTEQPNTPSQAIVRNLIILDASGSMTLIYKQALSGLNETIQTIRQASIDTPDLAQKVTLSSFSTSGYNTIYNDVLASEALDIAPYQYRPGGGTPLYDAIGKGIAAMDAVKGENDSVLVTIITDGEENCSTEFNGPQIKALIEQKRGNGWVFTYIGANQDVERVASELSINHHMAFETTEEGTLNMFRRERSSRLGFYTRLKGKLDSAPNCQSARADDEDFSF